MRTIRTVDDQYGRPDMRFEVVDGIDSVAIRVKARIRFWAGTWFADSRVGVPYIADSILGRNVDPLLAAQAITEEIRRVEDVTEVLDVEFEYDGSERVQTYSARVETPFGAFVIDEPLVLPIPLAADIVPG